jgi:hypothetical protein
VNADRGTNSLCSFPADYRASGLLLHVTSLPSRYDIGDLGPEGRMNLPGRAGLSMAGGSDKQIFKEARR